LVFGSEIKSIIASGSNARDVDAQSFAEYLWYGNTFEERTIYRDVRALEPGHWMIVEDGRVRVEPWWRIEEWLAVAPPSTEPREAALHVREAVDAAVKRQLVSDV